MWCQSFLPAFVDLISLIGMEAVRTDDEGGNDFLHESDDAQEDGSIFSISFFFIYLTLANNNEENSLLIVLSSLDCRNRSSLSCDAVWIDTIILKPPSYIS